MLNIFRTLPALLNDLEGSDEAREVLVRIAWRRIAGEMLAEHTVPVALEGTTFAVAVSGRTWQKHLEDLSPEMIFKLNSVLGSAVVRSIRFRIDEKLIRADRARRKKEKEAGPAGNEAEIPPDLRTAAESISDESLRRAFLMAAGNCLVRKERIERNA